MKFNPKYCFEYFDQFNLCNTIKQINPYYKLYFNSLTKEYIIVNLIV